MVKQAGITLAIFAAAFFYFNFINWWLMDFQGLDYFYMWNTTGADAGGGGH